MHRRVQTVFLATIPTHCRMLAVQAPRLGVQAFSTHRRSTAVLQAVSMASKAQTAVDETDAGAFKRTDAEFRNWIQSDSEFAPEGNRVDQHKAFDIWNLH